MAWMVRRDFSQYAVVNFDMEPPCRELSPPIEYFQDNGLMHAYGRWTKSAIDIEDRFWPQRARLKTVRKSLPHVLGFCSFKGVSQAFRDCVEELEPGIHEFRPVEVLHKDGSPFGVPYYAINIRKTVFEAVDWDKTDAPSEESRGVRRMDGRFWRRTITMKKSVIGDLHLWIPEEVTGVRYMGVSDMLHDMLVERKLMKGIESIPVVEE